MATLPYNVTDDWGMNAPSLQNGAAYADLVNDAAFLDYINKY